jgi:hypothetical protein
MNRPIAIGARPDGRRPSKRRSAVAVVGSTLGVKLFGGADPVGRDVLVDGVPFRIVGVQAPSRSSTRSSGSTPTGIMIPLETYMDRMDADHKLTSVAVKLRKKGRPRRGLRARFSGAPSRPTTGSRTSRSRTSSPRPRAPGRVPRADARLARRPLEPRRDRAPRRRRRRPLGHAHLVLGPQVRDRPAQVARRVATARSSSSSSSRPASSPPSARSRSGRSAAPSCARRCRRSSRTASS